MWFIYASYINNKRCLSKDACFYFKWKRLDFTATANDKFYAIHRGFTFHTVKPNRSLPKQPIQLERKL
jgi:hypothetical protein